MFPDGNVGALFVRSEEADFPYTGPSAYLYRDGHILFRMRGDDEVWCDNALPDPSLFILRTMKFEMIELNLCLTVDGVLI